MKTRLSTVLGWTLLALSLIAWRPPAETPPVDRNSDAIRAVLAQPLTSDPSPLRIAREKLVMAKDEPAAKAIDLYLAAVAVRQVFGEASEPKGTVGDIVEGRIASPPLNALIRRVLDGTLRAEPTAEPMRHTPSTGDIEVFLTLRNVSARRVIEERFELKVGATELNCHADSKSVPIDSNAAVAWVCTTHESLIAPARLESALQQPGWIRLSVSDLKFDDPSLWVTTGTANWANNDRVFNPWQTARAELDALGCRERAACLKEAIPTLHTNPALVFAGVFAGAGLVAGTLIALFTRRRWRWGWGLAGVVAGAFVGGFGLLLMANSMVAFAVMIYGPAAFGGFLAGLLPALALVKGRHPE